MFASKRFHIVVAGVLGAGSLLGVFAAWANLLPGAAPPAPTPTARRMPMPARVQMARWSATAAGPAALGTLLQVYGRRLSPAQLEQLADARGKKASLAALERAARSARFQARVVQATFLDLPVQPLPAVAEWADGEFRVFVSTEGGRVEALDPATGSRSWLDPTALEGAWTGRLLLVHPKSL
jgi:ABC-type bacteriocin/lantibiotic exporter with double-glycine peptidase domain